MLVFFALLIGIFWSKGLSDLVKVKIGISLQCVPAFFIGLFSWGRGECHPWSVAAGGLVGFTITLSLYFGYVKDNPDAHPMDTRVIAVFCNVTLIFLLEFVRRGVTGTLLSTEEGSAVDKVTEEKPLKEESEDSTMKSKDDLNEYEDDAAFNRRPSWNKPKLCRFGERPLTAALVWKSMKGTWEPFTNPALVFLLFLSQQSPFRIPHLRYLP